MGWGGWRGMGRQNSALAEHRSACARTAQCQGEISRPVCWHVFTRAPLYSVGRPCELPQGDDCFSSTTRARVYVCDSCGHVVPHGSRMRFAGPRVKVELLGICLDESWKQDAPRVMSEDA